MENGTYSYRIESRDVDFTLKASLASLCDHILRAAGDDADRNNFGVRDLNCDGCSWVLLRMCVEIYRRLEEHEDFTVRTWVNDVNRMMTTRNMIVRDASGETVAAAVTQWAIIDTEKRRAVDVTARADFSYAVVKEPSPVSPPVRIPVVEPQTVQMRKVVYSDIDFNRHVGSVKYIGWLYDMLPEEIVMCKEAARLDINYIHEARFGQVLRVGMSNGEHSSFEVSTADGQPVCRAVMTWKQGAAQN